MKKVDYTKFSTAGEVPSDGVIDKRWWLAGADALPSSTLQIVRFLAENDTRREKQYQVSTRLYGNIDLLGLNGLNYTKVNATQTAIKDRISYNLVQSAIDTITAKMAKNKPKPLFLTSGGDYKIQRRAKKLDKFTEGIFYENNAYQLGPNIFRDSGVLGDGVVHVFDHYGRVKYERVLASELYVDWVEAFYGNPRQLHRVKNIDRQVLKDLFPQYKKQIEATASASAELIGAYQNVSDQITVCESWHLPSGPDATDGIHCINIDNQNLFLEDYKKDFFPFAVLSWSKRMSGFWAQGAAEQLQNLQLEINKILWLIQRSMHLGGTFKILMENGSKIVKEHLNNDIGSIITYATTKPEYITPPLVQSELYTHLQTLKTLGFEQVGVSMLSAGSQKPAGLDSGKALREFVDIESDRFQVIGQKYEQFFLDLAKLTIDVAKTIYAREKKYEVKVPGKRFIETIDWSDVDLDEDQYTMKIFPISSLPNEPSGRLSTIQEYMQAGLISPRSGRKLMDFPDLEQVEELDNAQEEWINKTLEKIIDGDGTPDSYSPPEPEMDLQLAKETVLKYIAEANNSGLEVEKTDLLRQWNTQLQAMVAQATQPQLGMMPGGQAMPQAAPQPTPTNDMIPNTMGAA